MTKTKQTTFFLLCTESVYRLLTCHTTHPTLAPCFDKNVRVMRGDIQLFSILNIDGWYAVLSNLSFG